MRTVLAYLSGLKAEVQQLRTQVAALERTLEQTKAEVAITLGQAHQTLAETTGTCDRVRAQNTALVQRNTELRAQLMEYERIYVHPAAAAMNRGAA